MAYVWTRREHLVIPNLAVGAHYDLPFFLYGEDVFIVDWQGQEMQCCEDTAYEAVDRRLFWLSVPRLQASCAEICVYHALAPANAPDFDANSGMMRPAVMRLQSPQYALLLAEFFGSGRPGVMGRWYMSVDAELAKNCVDVLSFEALGVPAAPCNNSGSALVLDTQMGRLALRRSLAEQISTDLGRLHVRAYFYDTNRDSSNNWLGMVSSFGSGSVGVATSMGPLHHKHYSFLHGVSPVGARGESPAWQVSGVPRTEGWHLFELCWEDQQLCISIDREPVSIVPAQGFQAGGELWLVSTCGADGIWAGAECLHTPVAHGTWELDVQSIEQDSIGRVGGQPWQHRETHVGRWFHNGLSVVPQAVQFVSDAKFTSGLRARVVSNKAKLQGAFEKVAAGFPPEAQGRGRYHPGMESMLGGTYDVVEVLDSGLVGLLSPSDEVWLFPPAVLEIIEDPPTVEPPPVEEVPVEEVESPAEEPAQEAPVHETPVEPQIELAPTVQVAEEPATFCIECWTVPSETDNARVRRAMALVVEQSLAAGVALPDNIELVGQCREKQHSGCFVYRFGTRRLHVSTRAVEGGRLLLVVRCGGGFADFADFARRHGSLENIKMQRNNSVQDRGVLRVTSVFSRGAVSIRNDTASLNSSSR